MKSFKNNFSVIFSLFVLLCSFQFMVFTDRIIAKYETYIANDYSIVVVSNETLNLEEILRENPVIKQIEELSTNNVIERLKNDVSVSNMELLQKSMPKFYTIKLDRFPSPNVSNSLKNDLLQKNSITKVEIFAQTYNKIYNALKLLSFIVSVFVVFVAIMSVLLVAKQMRIWTHEHQERIYVMNLFGASLWKKSAPLYKSAILDSILAAALAAGLFFALEKGFAAHAIFAELEIDAPKFITYQDGIILLSISLVIAIISSTSTMFRVRQI